eukprot:1161503-Pelagomonas_calceolata.AAC.10
MAHTRSMIRWAWASSLNMGNCARSTLEKNTLSTQYELIGGNTENTREYFQLDKLVAEEALIQSTCARPHKNLETLVPQRKLRGFEHPHQWELAGVHDAAPNAGLPNPCAAARHLTAGDLADAAAVVLAECSHVDALQITCTSLLPHNPTHLECRQLMLALGPLLLPAQHVVAAEATAAAAAAHAEEAAMIAGELVTPFSLELESWAGCRLDWGSSNRNGWSRCFTPLTASGVHIFLSLPAQMSAMQACYRVYGLK